MAIPKRKKKIAPATRATARPQAVVSLDQLRCCKDLQEWPSRWMESAVDILPGEQLVVCFRPFIDHLIQLQLSRGTICKHVDNLWVLGGEIIRDLNETRKLRKIPIPKLLFDTVEEDGPLPYGWEPDAALASFESTCRKLRRFLELQFK